MYLLYFLAIHKIPETIPTDRINNSMFYETCLSRPERSLARFRGLKKKKVCQRYAFLRLNPVFLYAKSMFLGQLLYPSFLYAFTALEIGKR